MSWLKPTIAASGLLSSWATPGARRPATSIFCAATISASRRCWAVRSRIRASSRGSPSTSNRVVSCFGREPTAIATDPGCAGAERFARPAARRVRDRAPLDVVHGDLLRVAGRAATRVRRRYSRKACSFASTSVPSRRVRSMGSRDPRNMARNRSSAPITRSRSRKFSSAMDAIEATRSRSPRSMLELGERAIEVGGHATDHVLPDADRHDGIGRDAGLARRVDVPGGDDPRFQGAEIRALARTPAQERGTEVGSMRAEPPLDRWSDGDEAGRIVRDAVGRQEGVDRPGRPERLVDEPTRSVDQLLERADRRAGAGQLVDLARSIRARARGVVAPDDLLGEPRVLETAGDRGRRELGQGFGRERHVVSAPRETEDADQLVLAMQPDEEQRADPGVDQLAPRDRVER